MFEEQTTIHSVWEHNRCTVVNRINIQQMKRNKLNFKTPEIIFVNSLRGSWRPTALHRVCSWSAMLSSEWRFAVSAARQLSSCWWLATGPDIRRSKVSWSRCNDRLETWGRLWRQLGPAKEKSWWNISSENTPRFKSPWNSNMPYWIVQIIHQSLHIDNTAIFN